MAVQPCIGWIPIKKVFAIEFIEIFLKKDVSDCRQYAPASNKNFLDQKLELFDDKYKQIVIIIIYENEENKNNCSGTPTFKSQRAAYQPNHKLLHHYQHLKNQLNS